MKYTVITNYGATGEGVTLCLLYVMATSKEVALERFTDVFGAYMAIGAEIIEGYDFERSEAKMLVTNATRELLEAECNNCFHAQLYFNFS